MSDPAPLPPAQADPAVQAGHAAQAAYNARLNAVDTDPNLDELARAEAIVSAYEQQTATLHALAEDLHNRRTTRYEHLTAQIPAGPGIPNDATPADRAVLAAAFRASLDQVRNATFTQLPVMLADALRYGDDVQMRAILTFAQDNGHTKLVDQWAEATGNADLLAELRALNAELHGVGPGRAWVAQALHAPNRPHNAYANLPILRQRAEQAARDAEQARRLATPSYRRY